MTTSTQRATRRRRGGGVAVVLVTAALALGGCATTQNYHLKTNDPFSRQLNDLYAERVNAAHWLLASGGALGVGVTVGTTFSTLHGLGIVAPPASTVGLLSSYAFSLLGAGVGIWAAVRYNRAVNDYLATLRLETQYYNLVSPPREGP